MCRTYQELPYDEWPQVEDLKLSRFKRFLLNHYFPIKIGKFRMKNWKGELPFYAWRCSEHGIVINYRSGFSQTLYCPKCRDEFFKNYHARARVGGVSGFEEVSIVGNAMRGSAVTLVDPSEDKEASPVE